MNGKTAKQDSIHLRSLERQHKALELRKMGFTYQEIGDHLQVSRQAANQYVKKAIENLKNNIAEEADDIRVLELERLDKMLVRLWRQAMPNAKDGYSPELDLKAMKLILEVMDRRAKYMGLDAASKIEHISLDKLDTEIQRLEAELGKKANKGSDEQLPSHPEMDSTSFVIDGE